MCGIFKSFLLVVEAVLMPAIVPVDLVQCRITLQRQELATSSTIDFPASCIIMFLWIPGKCVIQFSYKLHI